MWNRVSDLEKTVGWIIVALVGWWVFFIGVMGLILSGWTPWL